MKGEALFDQAQTFTGSNPAPGMPREWDPDATRDLFGGFQYNTTKGIYFGAGLTYTASVLPASPRLHDVGRQRLRSPRPAGADWLLPGRQAVRAAAGNGHADRAGDAGCAAQPRADGQGTLRAVHG